MLRAGGRVGRVGLDDGVAVLLEEAQLARRR